MVSWDLRKEFVFLLHINSNTVDYYKNKKGWQGRNNILRNCKCIAEWLQVCVMHSVSSNHTQIRLPIRKKNRWAYKLTISVLNLVRETFIGLTKWERNSHILQTKTMLIKHLKQGGAREWWILSGQIQTLSFQAISLSLNKNVNVKKQKLKDFESLN